jgi:Domain of unknown function (DUF6950)
VADVLVNFLREAAARPFVWGEFDCCLFFADWTELRCGVDPALELRGTYSTERQMRRLVKVRGGIVRLVGDCMARAGCKVTFCPQRGDIGLVRIGIKVWRERVVTVPTGAIAVSPVMWAIKTSERDRLAIGRFPLVRAWGVNG